MMGISQEFKIGRSGVLGTSIAEYTSLSEAPGKIIGVSGEKPWHFAQLCYPRVG